MKQVIMPEEVFNKVLGYLLSRPCSETIQFVNDLSAQAQLADVTITEKTETTAPESTATN